MVPVAVVPVPMLHAPCLNSGADHMIRTGKALLPAEKDPEPRGGNREARGGKPEPGARGLGSGRLTPERARAAAEGAEPRQGTGGWGRLGLGSGRLTPERDRAAAEGGTRGWGTRGPKRRG